MCLDYSKESTSPYTANLNFGLMCKKAKHCWALSTNFSVQLIKAKHDHEELSSFAELAQKSKLVAWGSDPMKQNYGCLTFIKLKKND